MATKKILGLDIGTNSIGWALINQDFENKTGSIIGMGSRIIPMSQDVLGDFDKGNSVSQTSTRTSFRGIRRLRERHLLRRERLHRVLNVLGWLPKHYAAHIDFGKRLGQFIDHAEPKLPYDANGEFIFNDSFSEMLQDFKIHQPEILNRTNRKGESAKIPYDWTIYYLRKKALSKKITPQELAWIILNFNQKRGYYQLRGEEETEEDKQKSFETLKVKDVVDSGETIRGKEIKLYDVYFENGWKYDKQITKPEDWINKTKEFIVTQSETKSGEIKLTFKTVDSEKDWIAIKSKTEQQINESDQTVGEYIYHTLLQNPSQKIRGKLIRTIERKFYKKELKAILSKQMELQPELFTEEQYGACVRELYQHNEAHRISLSKQDLLHLFIDDIIFYQPLASLDIIISRSIMINLKIGKSG